MTFRITKSIAHRTDASPTNWHRFLLTCNKYISFCIAVIVSSVGVTGQGFSVTHDLKDGLSDIYKSFVIDQDTIYCVAALGCDTVECMSVLKIGIEMGILIAERHFPWMDEGDKDVIIKDGESVIVCGSDGYYENAGFNFLVLDSNLDSIVHIKFEAPDSVERLGIRSVISFEQYFIVVGFAANEDARPYPAIVYWISKEDLELDSIVAMELGDDFTAYSQAFVRDSFLIVSYLLDSSNVFLKRGFHMYDIDKRLVWSWNSEAESYGQRGEDALLLANGNMIIEHAVDNSLRAFRVICINPEGAVQWIYDDPYHPFGRKDLYHFAQARNGDIIGCGEAIWPRDPTDITHPVEDGWHEGGYIFRLNSQTGEMIWEHVVVGYDSFWNYAGDFFLDVNELSDGSLVMCGGWLVYDSTQFLSYDNWLVRTDSDGCVIPDCGFPAFTTSTIHIDRSSEINNLFTLAPNPASDAIFISFSIEINVDEFQYSILTIEGKLIVQSKFPPEDRRIDISNLPVGMYFFSVSDKMGRILQVERMIKM